MKSINSIVKEYALNERLDHIAMKDKEFLKRDREYATLLEQCEKYGMNRKQMKLVDEITSAFADQSARYAELAYVMGLKDATSLLVGSKAGNV